MLSTRVLRSFSSPEGSGSLQLLLKWHSLQMQFLASAFKMPMTLALAKNVARQLTC